MLQTLCPVASCFCRPPAVPRLRCSEQAAAADPAPPTALPPASPSYLAGRSAGSLAAAQNAPASHPPPPPTARSARSTAARSGFRARACRCTRPHA
eukprot:757014-Rhodomonas_salina.1